MHLQVHSLFARDCSQSAIMIKARQSSSHAAMPFPNSKEVKFVEAEYSSIFPVHGLLRILVYLGLSPQVTLALFRNDGNQGDRLRTSRFVCIAKADLARPRAAGSYYGVIALLVPAAAVLRGHWINSIPLCVGMTNLKISFLFLCRLRRTPEDSFRSTNTVLMGRECTAPMAGRKALQCTAAANVADDRHRIRGGKVRYT